MTQASATQQKARELPEDEFSGSRLRKIKKELLKKAVHGHGSKPISKRGILETLFNWSFRGFVYPQIWEDPEVDLAALKLDKTSRILTIASGGCNVMNYLTEEPETVKALDLNQAHVALTRLKIAAIKHLPDYESFFLFFGHADDKRNIENYDTYIKPHLDNTTRNYWESRGWNGQRRIHYFRKNLYQFGLLGRFIGAIHILARIYGKDPRDILNARNKKEQEEIFGRTLAPLFDKSLVRFLCSLPVTLYGLGIPPSQFDELNEAAKGNMADLLRERLHRLACDFPIKDNYFAWQAFGRGYDLEGKKALPRYLKEEHYEALKKCADRVEVHNALLTDFMNAQPPESLDCFVLLDAQDWMNPAQLRELWDAIHRSAAPGARVIFRTAGLKSPLTGALDKDMLKKWHYDPKDSRQAVKKDRSSIYGGFHVYTLGGEVGLQKNKKKKAEKVK